MQFKEKATKKNKEVKEVDAHVLLPFDVDKKLKYLTIELGLKNRASVIKTAIEYFIKKHSNLLKNG